MTSEEIAQINSYSESIMKIEQYLQGIKEFETTSFVSSVYVKRSPMVINYTGIYETALDFTPEITESFIEFIKTQKEKYKQEIEKIVGKTNE